MRVSGIAAGLVIVSAGIVQAQAPVRHGAASAPRPSVQQARPAPVRPSPTPLPATRPAPHHAQAPRPVPSTPFEAGPFTYAPRYTPRPGGRPPRMGGWGYNGFLVPSEIVVSPPPEAPPDSLNEISQSGSLELAVEPRSADVYVDGFYVGTVEDVAQNGLLLRAGRHWVDLRAGGYATLTVPVTIAAGQGLRYRGELVAAGPQPVATESVRTPQTMYVISGCYAGNRPPTESALPRGCDIAKLRTLTLR
jgi:hypothetical protein